MRPRRAKLALFDQDYFEMAEAEGDLSDPGLYPGA